MVYTLIDHRNDVIMFKTFVLKTLAFGLWFYGSMMVPLEF